MSDFLEKVIALREAGEYSQAIELLNHHLASNNADITAWGLLAHLYTLVDDLDLARTTIDRASAIDQGSPAVGWNSVRILLKQQKFSEALEIAAATHREAPEDVEGWGLMGNSLRLNNRNEEALVHLDKAILSNSANAEAYANRGLIKLSTNSPSAALDDLDKALSIKPHLKQLWTLVASLKLQTGDYQGANEVLRLAMEVEPSNIEYILARATVFQKLGELDGVITHLNMALTIQPEFAAAYVNLGVAYKSKGDIEKAIESFVKAIQIDSQFVEAHYNLGNAYKQQDKLGKAITSFSMAISINSDFPDAYTSLCEIYEKLNQLQALFATLESAREQLKVIPADLQYYEALYLFRCKEFFRCAEILERVELTNISESTRPSFLNLKGICYDKVGAFEQAFSSFCQMNELVMSSREFKEQKADTFFDSVQSRARQLSEISPLVIIKSEPADIGFSPTFMIGFPRSGTTLLDSILRSHSNIDVIEEKPMLSKAKSLFGGIPLVGEIEDLDDTALNNLRAEYLKELALHSELTPGDVVIDKMPLNIIELPLIHRIFPSAKYILAIRHPLDCILSCFMHSFDMNPAMANMVKLDRAVNLYCFAMAIMDQSNTRYSLNIHRVQYEKLVDDFEQEVTALLIFLNLDWQQELREYQETALKRDRIKTPSYSQVVQPIYKDAVYRWRHYEPYLSLYLDKLEPWLKEFDYSH
jgi:tetratricopeptide (TPR) repeat protein